MVDVFNPKDAYDDFGMPLEHEYPVWDILKVEKIIVDGVEDQRVTFAWMPSGVRGSTVRNQYLKDKI